MRDFGVDRDSKTLEYFVYFKAFEPMSCGKRSIDRRR